MKETRTTTNVWKQCKEFASGKNELQKAVIWIFAVVAAGLVWMARKMHLTYNAVNVLVYYWLIPATWTFMLDWKLDCHISIASHDVFFPMLTVFLCFMWVGIILATVMFFGKWCDLIFNASVDFLNYFNRWGGNYVLNSVVICVVIPIIIYIVLTLMLVL